MKNDFDERGIVKAGLAKEVYLRCDIENKLDDLLSDVNDFINRYMGY